MATDYAFWSNVQVDVQTTLATAQNITAITKANPGIVTYAGTDPANLDVVVLDTNGMVELKDRAFQVASVDTVANTFSLQEDTALYRTFTSGSLQLVTLGASMTNVQNVNFGGGDPEFADLTTIHDAIRRRAPTVVSPFTGTFDCLWKASDTAVGELKKAFLTRTKRVFRFTFADGQILLANAYVAAANIPTGAAQEVVKTTVTLEFQGFPTIIDAP